MRVSGEWKGAIHNNVRTWAYGQSLNQSILPICKEFYLRVDDILLGVGAIVPTRESCVCPAHLASSPAGRTRGSGS